MEGLFVVLGIAAFIAIAVFSWIAAEKRRKALAALAESWGFRWAGGGDPFGIEARYGGFAALARGHSRAASNVFHGTRNGREAVCFDYKYVTGSGKNRHTHRLSGAIISLGVPTPRLCVRPEGFFDRIAEFVGMDDIDFESAEFSRTFHVTSDNRKFAFDVFHARAMEYMLRLPRRFTMELRGGQVMVHDDRTWAPADFDAAIRQVEGLADLFPDYLRRALKEGTV
jgi:hypothetical protein